MTIFIGIDIGLDGAIACVGPSGAVSVDDVPTIVVGKNGRREYDIQGILAIVRPFAVMPEKLIYMESLNAFPGQGVTSMFSLGRGMGIWEGILSALNMPYQKVHPVSWKKVMIRGVAQGKGASIVVAKRLWPNIDLHRKKDHNRADALLLAEYGRRTSGLKGE